VPGIYEHNILFHHYFQKTIFVVIKGEKKTFLPSFLNAIVTKYPYLMYRGFHEKGTFSVHSFNDDYLSIPERPGSYKYLFHEIPVMLKYFLLILK